MPEIRGFSSLIYRVVNRLFKYHVFLLLWNFLFMLKYVIRPFDGRRKHIGSCARQHKFIGPQLIAGKGSISRPIHFIRHANLNAFVFRIYSVRKITNDGH